MTPRESILLVTRIQVEGRGDKFQKDVFDKAYKKLQIWCRDAYGTTSTKSYVEGHGSGCNILFYYDECLEGVTRTFNRQSYQTRRQNEKEKKGQTKT